MLLMSSSETSVPMEISAASLTSCSTSSGRTDDRSLLAVLSLSPAIRYTQKSGLNVFNKKFMQCKSYLQLQPIHSLSEVLLRTSKLDTAVQGSSQN